MSDTKVFRYLEAFIYADKDSELHRSNNLKKIEDLSVEDKKYKKYKKAYKYAMEMTLKELKQAAEGFFHNTNSLQSRSGNQLPFTSINYGLDTTPEGRMITNAILDASIDGVGPQHLTAVFPCQIFQYKKGVNDKPGTPNYDLKLKALESMSKRLYPNFANCDWSNQKAWLKYDRDLKEKMLKNLSDEDYKILEQAVKDNPEMAKKIGLKYEE